MTTKKWALRVIAAGVFFTAIICLSAPAHSLQAPMNQQQVETFIKHEATCYVMAQRAGLEKQRARHLFNLSEFTQSHLVAITHAVGYANGWIDAVAHYIGVPPSVQAAGAHEAQCLEKA